MIRLIIKIISVLIFIVITSAQNKIGEIRMFDISDSLLVSRLNSIFSNHPYNKSQEDSLKKIIGQYLFSNGYFFCGETEINTLRKDSTFISVQIKSNSGNRAKIQNINLGGDFKEENSHYINSVINKLQNTLFNYNNLETSFNQIIDFLNRQGYILAKIELSAINPYKDKNNNLLVDLSVNINLNKQLFIDDIMIPDKVVSKKNYLKNIINFSERYPLTENSLIKFENRLNKISYFAGITRPEIIVTDSQSTIVKLNFIEKNMNFFDGLIGYVPETKSSSGYLSGFIDLRLLNIFGTGREIGIRWSKTGQLSQNINLEYYEPFILNTFISARIKYHYKKQDSVYTINSTGVELEAPLFDDFYGSILLEYESTVPGNSYINKISNSTAITSGIAIKFDNRNRIFNPTKGLFLENIYKYSSKKTDLFGTEKIQRLELNFQYFLPFSDVSVMAFKSAIKNLSSANPEFSDLYLLGGNNTLRGYRENQFSAKKVVYLNSEFRFFYEDDSYVFAFFDSGYYETDEIKFLNIKSAADFIYGYGFGIGFSTQLGVFNVSYALGKGDTFSDGKIHIGINTNF